MNEVMQHATTMLTRLTQGDGHAADELTPIVYEHLRNLAASLLVHERAGHTLQPTALVHEAYVRLIDQRNMKEGDRAAFIGLAATIMRRILVDHARARKRVKRGGEIRRVEIRDSQIIGGTDSTESTIDIEALDRALIRLSELDERKAQLIELRFFGGIDENGAADLLGISRATASREWRMARSWLAREILTEQDSHGEKESD